MAKKITLLVLSLIAIVLEALPYSVAMRWMSGNVTYEAYFSGIAYGYGIFTPILTAILTCVIVVLCIVALFVNKRGLGTAISVISIIATLIAPFHFVIGTDVTALGIIITVWLFIITVISFIDLGKLCLKKKAE